MEPDSGTWTQWFRRPDWEIVMRNLSAKEMVCTVVGMERIARERAFVVAGKGEGVGVMIVVAESMLQRTVLLRLTISRSPYC